MNNLDTLIDLNNMDREYLLDALHLDIREIVLKTIIEKMKSDDAFFLKSKKYYFKYSNFEATQKIIQATCNIEMSNDDICWLGECIGCYLKKKSTRAVIPQELKLQLLIDQNEKCALCGTPITLSTMHVDHIIPWDYVGDELENNYQGLCSDCNLHKSNHVATTVSNFILKKRYK